MTTRKKASKPPKPVDPEVLRKRIQKAVLTLRKSMVIAMRQELMAVEQSVPLNALICTLDSALMAALPRHVSEKTTEATLPF